MTEKQQIESESRKSDNRKSDARKSDARKSSAVTENPEESAVAPDVDNSKFEELL